MTVLKRIAIYLLAGVFIGALLAPWAYLAVENWAPSLARKGFAKVFNRTLMLSVVVVFVVGWRKLQLREFTGLGLKWDSMSRRYLLWGVGFGILSLAVLSGLNLAFSNRIFSSPGIIKASLALVKFALAGAIVGLIEEVFFRGIILGALRQMWSWSTALLISSLVYVLPHFMKSPSQFTPETIHWWTGLALLPKCLGDWSAPIRWVPEFLSLFLVGIILGWVFLKTRSLWMGIGLHAGWVFLLKTYDYFSDTPKGAGGQDVWLYGSGRLINGFMAVPVLIVCCLLVVSLCSHLEKQNASSSVDSPGA